MVFCSPRYDRLVWRAPCHCDSTGIRAFDSHEDRTAILGEPRVRHSACHDVASGTRHYVIDWIFAWLLLLTSRRVFVKWCFRTLSLIGVLPITSSPWHYYIRSNFYACSSPSSLIFLTSSDYVYYCIRSIAIIQCLTLSYISD